MSPNRALLDRLKAADLTEAERAEVKTFCRKVGVGKSKAVLNIEEKREKWLKSKDADKIRKAFPKYKQAAVTIFNVARGQANRPKYADDSELYDKMLDLIDEKYI
jgi:hypothetical protein